MQSFFATHESGLTIKNCNVERIDNAFRVFQYYGRSGEDRASLTVHNAQEAVFKSEEFLRSFYEDIRKKCVNEKSGSTACVLLITKNEKGEVGFTVANLGDSGCVFLIEKDNGELLIIKLTEDHKPNLTRIRKIAEDKFKEVGFEFSPISIDRAGNYRIMSLLAVGGALGDEDFKDLVLQEPDIFKFIPGTQEYKVLEEICKKEGINLQDSIKTGKTRLVSFTDGIIADTQKIRTETVDENSYIDVYQKYCVYHNYEAAIEDGEYYLVQPEEHALYDEKEEGYNYWEGVKNHIFGIQKINSKEELKMVVPSTDDITLISCDPSAVTNSRMVAIGVFDGHGGKKVSDLAHKELPIYLEKQLENAKITQKEPQTKLERTTLEKQHENSKDTID